LCLDRAQFRFQRGV